jgi:hypothetical protein
MKYIIYKITINDYTYIGSTRDFNQRKMGHKTVCNNANDKAYNSLVYKQIREAGGWDKCEMIPIEEYDCEGQLQARIREEYWRREYNATLNSIKAYTTEEQKKDYHAEWTKNKYVNQPFITCDCGSHFLKSYKPLHEKTKKHMAYLETQNLAIL